MTIRQCHVPLWPLWDLDLWPQGILFSIFNTGSIFVYLFLLQAIYFDAVCLFSGDKVEEIVDIMTEKEIRLQIPLEEVDILMEETQDKKNEEEPK